MLSFDPHAFTGRPILLVGIRVSDPREVFFSSGTARVGEASFALTSDSAQFEFHADIPATSLRVIDPEMLPVLLTPKAYKKVERLTTGVEAVIALFTEFIPATSFVLRDPLYGLARGPQGQPILFQGDPGASNDDEELDPWHSSWSDDSSNE